MAEWMYAHTLPVEDHPQGCTCGGCGGPMLDDDDYDDYTWDDPDGEQIIEERPIEDDDYVYSEAQ